MFQAEYETKLNRVCLHIDTSEQYKEDYQIPMLRQNSITGVLEMEGCEVEGRGRYTYQTGGMLSMKCLYEKTWMKYEEIMALVSQLLETMEELQTYMLYPECLLLKPEYIFYKGGKWFFCYLPGKQNELMIEFHQLTEFFVRTLDYGDTEGIFLTYELHRATLQEQYDLVQIIKEYEMHKMERTAAAEVKKEEIKQCVSEKDGYAGREGDEVSNKRQSIPQPENSREETCWWKSWKRTNKSMRKKRWGNWEDLILETDGQEENPIV